MNQFVIVAESGADLPKQFIEQFQIHVLPMHVVVGGVDYADGSILVEEVCGYYDKTGKVPTTSAVNPDDYRQVFEKIRKENPDAIIIHISYTSKASCTYQNALIAAEGFDNIYHIDSLNVSAGQAIIVMKAVQLIEKNPGITPESLVTQIKSYVDAARFSFLPGNLDYLRAGGRVTNAQYLGATLLKLKPLIEMIDGKLTSVKKYRGSMKSIVIQMMKEYFLKFNIDKSEVYLVHAIRTDEDTKSEMEKCAKEFGVKNIVWLQTGCVITSHAGPGGLGIAGMEVQ